MESRIQALFSTILVVTLFTLLRPGLAEFRSRRQFPFIPELPIDPPKCPSSLLNQQGCEMEIFKSFFTGKFENIEPACCKAFKEVDTKCWLEMFPLNPLFPPFLKDACSRIIAATPAHTKPQFPIVPRFSFPGFSYPGSPIDLTKCLSSLINIPGCISEIHKSALTGKFGHVGPMCCKAFLAVDAKCWPKMFPLNPFFPPLLKKECSRINAAAPTHK